MLWWFRPVSTSKKEDLEKLVFWLMYKDLDHAIRLCMQFGKGCYMAKSDMKSAFRHLVIRKEDWKWLVLMVRHPVTDEKFYFYDKNLPFGASISDSHFQRVSNGIQAIFQWKKQHKANNYLDDFLFVTCKDNM